MSARVMLERISIPVLAIGQDGGIPFANDPFAHMLGYTGDALLSMRVQQLFRALRVDESAFSFLRACAEDLVELVHSEGWTVRAKMSKSVLLRGDEPCVLVMFQNLTEQLWTGGDWVSR